MFHGLVATGGLYFDVDMETIVDSRTLIRNDTRFVSPQIVNDQGKPMDEARIGGFFQSFIAATPNHPILREYLDQILYWYEADQPNLNPSHHDAEEGRSVPIATYVHIHEKSAAPLLLASGIGRRHWRHFWE